MAKRMKNAATQKNGLRCIRFQYGRWGDDPSKCGPP